MSSPFYTGTVPYAGEQPADPAPWNDWSSRRFWIGKTGAMYELPNPHTASGYSSTLGRGLSVDGLYGGGFGTTEFDGVGRPWTYGWERLAPRDWQLVRALGLGKRPFGSGPYIFLPPEDANRLTGAQSMCGVDTGTVEGWAVSGGTLSPYTVFGAEPAILGGAPMKWNPAAAGDLLVGGTLVGGVPTPDLDYGLPYVPAEPVTVYIWAWTTTGSAQLLARARGCDDTGGSPVDVDSATVTVTTTPARVAVSADPGAFGSSLWTLAVFESVDGAPIVLSNPQLSLTTAPVDWEQGTGAPRVNVTAELAPTVDQNFNRAATLALGEAFPGAA